MLVDRIGGGGGGVVYAALQRPLDRVVAIKVLHAHLTATPDARAQFLREAKALSRLKSRQTVAVYDFGVTRLPAPRDGARAGGLNDIAYMVMEFVAGESLAARILRCGPLTPLEAANIVRDLARSLDEAHRRRIVHRDIKPGNVILGVDPERPGAEIARVIDFGIASMAGEAHMGDSEHVVGSPHYMAPELCHPSRRGEVSGRTDVYSVGVTLFEMLTGRRPYRAPEPLKLLYQHVHDPPPPLPGSDRDAGLAALQTVVHRAMAKRPDARFATVGAVADALDAAVGRARPARARSGARPGRIPTQMRNITALYRLEDEARSSAPSQPIPSAALSGADRPSASSPRIPARPPRAPTPPGPARPASARPQPPPPSISAFDQAGVLDAHDRAALNALAHRRKQRPWLGPLLVLFLGLGAVAAWWFSQDTASDARAMPAAAADRTPRVNPASAAAQAERVGPSDVASPVTAAAAPISTAVGTDAPASTAVESAAPASAASDAKAPVTTAPAPTARQLAWRVQSSVRAERCAQAESRLEALAAHPNGATHARRLAGQVERCAAPKPTRGSVARVQIGNLDIKRGDASVIKRAVDAQRARLSGCGQQHGLRVVGRALLNLRLSVSHGRASVRVRHSSTGNARFDACAQSAIRQSAVAGDAQVDVPVLIKPATR